MMEIMRAKNAAADKNLEEQKADASGQKETVDDRKKRLQATRALL